MSQVLKQKIRQQLRSDVLAGLREDRRAQLDYRPMNASGLRRRRLRLDGRGMFDWDAIEAAAEPIAEVLDADIIVYNGPIERQYSLDFLKMCSARKGRRKNVVLVLITPGGDAHAAYRISRWLQDRYAEFYAFVPGWCKSAGTLLIIGADHIIMGECAELGPLDIQRGKQDELWESSSGLTEDAAIETLEKTAFKMFEDYLFSIKRLSGGQVTFKTAAEVASSLVIGQLEPIYMQIDPSKIGENTRGMNIARDYGKRLNLRSGNLKGCAQLEKLAASYSSHGFVIDRQEAEGLFNSVSEPDEKFNDLAIAMGHGALIPLQTRDDEPPTMRFVNKEPAHAAAAHPGTASTPAPHDAGGDSGGTAGAEAANDLGKVATLRTSRAEGE